ncbi:Uma2 family endonuclease [Actinokineospora sp. PR83]|uniref:Uma2 family endonuclease n=1 Tax=Actinokineospora sp. PR83 TaxID=2884908 RepID=UPI001F21C20B|nr:Uma2 family endonuclease [Actinokineospora sp. PR83]MCG8914863.1 Uma2 family endonuclease [Actinokineospora sp. PR83]
MTAMPQHQHESSAPTHLLTIEEYAALGETESGYTELQEGRLLMSPSPNYSHMRAIFRIASQLDQQAPDDLVVVGELDIDMGFAPHDQPGDSRRPDIIVCTRTATERVKKTGGLIRASEVVVVIEVISPGSRRTDRKIKRIEYAEAGIPCYWMLDLDDPVSLLACRRTEEFGYVDDQEATGVFRTDVPFPVTIDLNSLG